MKRMSDQTLEEFKKNVMEDAIRRFNIAIECNIDCEIAFKRELEDVFQLAHIRGSWAGDKGIFE